MAEPDDDKIEVIRKGAEVIGALEYSNELDHFKVWTTHGYTSLMYDHDEAVRWVREIHAEHVRNTRPSPETRAPLDVCRRAVPRGSLKSPLLDAPKHDLRDEQAAEHGHDFGGREAADR